MPIIQISHLVKRYDDALAVDDLSLDINEGEFFTFLGPNGAGKTTTMKLMTGLLKPTSGTVTVDGFDISRFPVEVKSRVGYIPDHPYLYGKLTGWEFLHFVGGLYSMSRTEILTEGKRLLERFDLGRDADRLVETYSHGMRQRLAFAACFLHHPRVVIVDEPWVGLDPRNIRNTVEFLRERTGEGTTIFMSTHSLTIAQNIASRIGILHRGRLIFDGQASELHDGASQDIEEAFLQMTADESHA